jgi:hypothetical protein
METIGNSLNQSMADIFEVQSDIAKERDKTKEQIQQAKIYLNKFKDNPNELIYSEIVEFLKIFYKNKELKKQLKRLDRLTETEILTSLYSVVTHRMEKLEMLQNEIKETIKV